MGVLRPQDRARIDELFLERRDGAGDEYRIGPGDEVNVSVFRVDALDGRYTIERDGSLLLPMIGSVLAAGRSESELATEISRLLEERFLNDPVVRVTVGTFVGSRVSVMGAAPSPGFYPIENDGDTILDVLNRAGGIQTATVSRIHFTPKADAVTATRSHPVGVEAEKDAIEIDLTSLQSGGFVRALALPVRGGDAIYVEEAGQVIVEGWVVTPGTFALRPGLTLAQAITRAGGLHFGAAPGSIVLSRKSDSGVRAVTELDYDDVADGSAEDPRLQAGDRIHVGGNPVKVAAWGVYEFVSTVVSIGVGARVGL